MKNKKIKIALVLFLLVFFPFVNASVDILINVRPVFYEGESLNFDYYVLFNEDTEVQYTPLIDCPEIPSDFLFLRSHTMSRSEVLKDNFEGGFVSNKTESQNCFAVINVHYPFEKTFSEEFSIVTSPVIDFNVLLDKKVFVKGENVLIDYSSSINDLNIESKLTYPSGSSKEIELPFSFSAEDTGSYVLDLVVSKEGYRSVLISEDFGIIEADAKISSRDDVDYIFEDDFPEEDFPDSDIYDSLDEPSYESILIIVVFVVVLIIIAYILFSKKSSKKK